ncbi:MAG: hypothetical protein NVV60_00625 [Luteimonas sp.]|nr:hypothetical protein [Luteimonas sp.]
MSVYTPTLAEADRRDELHIKSIAILRVIRSAALNTSDPAGEDDIAHAAWAVEGMLKEIKKINRGYHAGENA